MNIDKITNEALQLESKDRAILAETIWKSLEDPYIVFSDSSDKEALCLARQRDNEIERGEVKVLSHTELMSRLGRGN
jgi:hypothetical protein